jgi:hypothetical protein
MGAEMSRIKSRGDHSIRRVRGSFVQNDLASVFGLDPARALMGRHPTSQWMTKVAAGDEPLNDEEQEAILSVTAATAIADKSAERLVRLERDIEFVNLNQLIKTYDGALASGHNGTCWQNFCRANVFVLKVLIRWGRSGTCHAAIIRARFLENLQLRLPTRPWWTEALLLSKNSSRSTLPIARGRTSTQLPPRSRRVGR